MWDELSPGLGRAHIVLLDEACRMADRLDKLDALLAGDADTWCELRDSRFDNEPVLVINSAMSEARQTATALRQLIHEISAVDSGEVPQTGGSKSDDLANRRAERLAKAALP